MTGPWSGTYAFLLSDIEGSTRMWEEAPAEMARALARHDELLGLVAASHRGRVVRSRGEGDSAFVVFSSPLDAVACGAELQHRLAREAWPPRARIRVRVAIHNGPAEARDDDFYGPAINRAARMRSAAHGGQLVVSDAVRDAIGQSLPEDLWLIDLGVHRLRDLSRPERLWQVAHAELQSDFPPLRSLDARGHNLPVQPTSFVGRETELAAMRKRLESAPIVTLVGPGGIGKTRLALQAAADSIDDFADGVWFVDLSPVADEALIPLATAGALGLREEPGREVTATLADHLRTRSTLIVLDNCEHVIDASAKLVAGLLSECEGLRVLATSREPLRVYGEATWQIPTLETPESDAHPEEVATADAVRLFVDRARLVDDDFALTHETSAIVARVCARLEGIPLAIELAAAMTAALSLDEIDARLADRLAALTEGPRTVPLRQRTLRGAIDWSHDLLSDGERAVFAQASVFAGGFMLDAAEVVCAGEAVDVPAVVERLVHRSLLVVGETPIGARYGMLDTVRDYARDALVTSGAEAEVRSRHLAWAREIATRLAEEVSTPQREPAVARLTAEHDNVRAALEWGTSGGDRTTAAHLAAAMGYYWLIRGHLREGRRWLAEVLPSFPPGDPMRPRVLYGIGQIAMSQGDRDATEAYLTECAESARAAGDVHSLAVALNLLAGVALQEGRVADAKTQASEALDLLRPEGANQFVAQSLNILGVAATFERDIPAARRHYEDALAIARDMGHNENMARILMNLGNIALHEAQDRDTAQSYYEEALDTAKRIGDVQTASAALTNLAQVARLEGRFDEATRAIEESLTVKRDIGDARGISIALHALAEIRRAQGDAEDARSKLAESLALMRDIGFSQGLLQGLETMAAVLVDLGELHDAARLCAAVESARTALGLPRTPDDITEFERSVAAAKLGERFDDAWREGESLSLEDAAGLVTA